MIDAAPPALGLAVPGFLDAPEVTAAFQESALWINGGGGASLLHYDNIEGVLCAAAGRKRVMLISPTDAGAVPIDHPEGDYVGVDVSNVNRSRCTPSPPGRARAHTARPTAPPRLRRCEPPRSASVVAVAALRAVTAG